MSLALLMSACGGKGGSASSSEELCSTPPVIESSESNLTMMAPKCASLDVQARVLGDGEYSVSFTPVDGGWQPQITAMEEGVFRGLVLEGTHEEYGDSDSVLWRQGYQSWSFSGVVDVGPLTLDEAGVPQMGGDGDATAVVFERDGTSWWMGAIGKHQGASLFAGALSREVRRWLQPLATWPRVARRACAGDEQRPETAAHVAE